MEFYLENYPPSELEIMFLCLKEWLLSVLSVPFLLFWRWVFCFFLSEKFLRASLCHWHSEYSLWKLLSQSDSLPPHPHLSYLFKTPLRFWDDSVGLCCSITIFSVVYPIFIGIQKHTFYNYWRLLISDSLFSLCTKLLRSCPDVWDPLDCSPPGSSVHGVLQTGILEGVAMSSLRGSSWPRDGIQVSYICCIG